MSNIFKVNTIVDGTSTNGEGHKLYLSILDGLTAHDQIILSFKDSSPIASSFFNSSFGIILDTHGYTFVKDKIKIVDLSKSQNLLLKKYFTQYLELA